jgi:hypothetical protein
VRWYVDNRWWWEPIRSGEFQDYYQWLYGQRKVIGQVQGEAAVTAARRASVEDETACGWLSPSATDPHGHRRAEKGLEEGHFWVLPVQQNVWVESGGPLAFLVVEVERRPAALSVPSRSFCAFAMECADTPEAVLRQLSDAFFQHALLGPGAHCLIAFGAERWF